jgi:hypothetical protein
MSLIVAGAVFFVAALAQVTVAPLFPLEGAVVDLGLVALLGVALAAGPRPAMVALPVLAICLGFAGTHSPGLVLLLYLPLLPLAFLLEQAPVPLGNYLRLGIAMVATGLWSRAVVSGVAFTQGADVPPVDLVVDVLIPGLIFDVVFFTLLYVPLRLLGRSGRSMTLRRTGWELA